MAKREVIKRYALIINKLRKRPATFAEIDDYLKRESELDECKLTVSKRTFQRDLDEIASIYNVEIVFDPKRQVYHIAYSSEPEIQNRLLEAFDTFNVLNVADGISGYMQFENRTPKGTENLNAFIQAIKNQFQIKFTYQKFEDDDLSQRLANPYLLKEFKNRWYVLAKDCKDEVVKSFAIDRITELEITNKKFEIDASYNAEEIYRHCFGIISSTNFEPQEIILSFDAHQGKYIKTLPLHDTQNVLIDNEQELRISLQLYITHDFIMELLSHGDKLKVIKPQYLIDEMKNTFLKALKKYEG